MHKRVENNKGNEYSMPAKRPRYDAKEGNLGNASVINIKKSTSKTCKKSSDIWGDDFAEEDIEEMDFVASQAVLQGENVFSQSRSNTVRSSIQGYDGMPSTSKGVPNMFDRTSVSFEYSLEHDGQMKQVVNSKDESVIVSADYREFENKLKGKKVYNSTFKPDESSNNDTILGPSYIEQLEKLRLENKKLLDNLVTKDGEVVFLRNQLHQIQSKASNDKQEKTHAMEEQKKQHRQELANIRKEKENLETELELQTLEAGNLYKRCKLLESGSVKLTEPHTANLNASLNRSKVGRSNSPVNWSQVPPERPVKMGEPSRDDDCYILRISNTYSPLANIPKSIFDLPQPEKPVIDIQLTEKIRQRNLPILQDEDTFRIYKTPELVKPITAMIDDKRLTVEFILPEVADLRQRTSSDLETESTIPMINKLISTSRELLLSVIAVLETILQTMRNDDIRDMNDIYFSGLYSSPDYNGRCVCSANAWHESERGVETRRMFGLLSYVASELTYFSKYVAGKTRLLSECDESYKSYLCQMKHYNKWAKKGCEFEMLQMILEFVTLIGSTRRSHQFSGLTCAILMLIYNVHTNVGYCSQGIEYVYKIFKEIVFARPMPYCYTPLSSVMMIFVDSPTHLRKVCSNSQSTALKNWEGSLHFTTDACPLQIFLAQLGNYDFDIVSTIDIVDVLIQFIQHILQLEVIPLRPEAFNSCSCCIKLVRLTLNLLCKCSAADLSAIERFNVDNASLPWKDCCNLESICTKHSPLSTGENRKCIREIYRHRFLDENNWTNTKRKQTKVLRDGIRYLSHLAICDPEFVTRFSDIEDSIYLFLRNLKALKNFVLHETEQEAMNLINQTFVFDKTLQPGGDGLDVHGRKNHLDIIWAFEKMSVEPTSTRKKKKEDVKRAILTYKTLLKRSDTSKKL